MTAVWLYGTRVGELWRPRTGKLRFDFTNDAIDRWGVSSTVLSTSMPMNTSVRPAGTIVSAFFKNLLPEGDALSNFRTTYRAFDDLALLEAIGRDTAGAVIIADDPTARDVTAPRYLTNDEVAQLLFNLPQRALGASLLVRHSLAGAQKKLLLGRTADGRWYEASGSHPSTHLLKPAPLEHGEIAPNEAFCMEVARQAGLDTCVSEEVLIGTARVLVAQRYDRLAAGIADPETGTTRLHQEDGCQMLGLPPENKYEQRRSGNKRVGPSLARIARWLDDKDKVRLLEAQVLNVLIGNADCHGKNVSILHKPDATLGLAPLYDVMSTVVHHPIMTVNGPKPLTQDLGMLIGNAGQLGDVTLAEFVREAAQWPVSRDEATHTIRNVTERILHAVNACEGKYLEIAEYAYRAAEQFV